ncbi:discoidin domain-containing protein [Haloferula chungangensis]|uniref:Discoidin domain-containing protein n=1 Tax=Haloferula chungangensis TaxID=1048331 RepID=A0ABW2L653_9BACT
MPSSASYLAATFALLSLHAANAAPGDKVYQSDFLSKEEALESIELPDGYHLELLLSEPLVEEPVMTAWDGNGAMYVVQMRTYMQDIDASGEKEPTSIITRHVDTNGDGTYDKHSIFAKDLKLPRFVLPLDDRVIVGITDTLDLWTYRDSNGDGVSDEVEKIYEGGRRGGNMEHQPSGLTWALDNWMYLTYEAKRYRFTDGKFVVQDIPRGSGQWGLTQDDWGRLYYSDAGGEKPAITFQQPIVYGALNLSGQEESGFRDVFPIAEVPDVQAGLRRVGPNGGLNGFTGTAGQSIFRGDRLPEDLRGDLLIPEPVGRMIRRAKVDRSQAKTVLRNATPGTEFIRTRDVNFRPVWTATTPGGQLAIVDMHRGIIQQGHWTRRGSYLREVIQKWKLDKNIGKGRIYRLVHKDFKAGPQPRMLDEKTSELLAHLSHPNGWWRDTAQRLIILREDRESVVPQLQEMARKDPSELGRLHALWTLEGIGNLEAALVIEALNDSDSIVRTSAIRMAEPFMATNDPQVIAAFESGLPEDPEMLVQLINSISASGTTAPEWLSLSKLIEEKFGDVEVIREVLRLREEVTRDARLAMERQQEGAQFAESMQRGEAIYRQLCFSCHGEDGHGTPIPGRAGAKLAPSFTGSPRVLGTGDSAVLVLLNGLTGPIDGKTYEGLMVPMANNDDQWIADAVTYLRNSFDNEASMVSPERVAELRKQHAKRSEAWTVEELAELEPEELAFNKNWKLSASHNEKELKLAFDGDDRSRYTTGKRMSPGMWVQIEFPKTTRISGITLDTTQSKGDFPRGYQIQISDNGKTWSDPIAEGAGSADLEISFVPVEARFLRITQTGNDRLYWSIHEMTLLGKAL